MDGFKSILASKTVWASILGFIASLPLFAKYFVGLDISAAAEQISSAVISISTLLAMVFRVMATKQVSATGESPKPAAPSKLYDDGTRPRL